MEKLILNFSGLYPMRQRLVAVFFSTYLFSGALIANSLTAENESSTQIVESTIAASSQASDDPEEQSIDTSSNEQEEEEGAAEMPVAPNVDLSEVAPIPEPVEAVKDDAVAPDKSRSSEDNLSGENQAETNVSGANKSEVNESKPNEFSEIESSDTPEKAEVTSQDDTPEHFVILGSEVQPGTSTRLAWSTGVTIAGLAVPTPVLVINGAKEGPTLCLSSAVHGDELNGIEIVRRIMYNIDPERLNGKIIGVPIVNLQGFQRRSRYLPDRRDLNRYFPGDEKGSLASRIAGSFFSEVITHCDMLVDLHTGSLGRTNLPQIRADMNNQSIAKLTEGFDKMVIVHSPGASGMLRTAASQTGIASVTMEIGESLRIQEKDIRVGVNSIYSLMEKEGMFSRRFVWGSPSPVYYQSFWVRAQTGGLLFSEVDLGDTVYRGQLLGSVTDPITNESSDVTAPLRGRVIGMAVDQVVMPGFAAYHIGKLATEETIVENSGEPTTVDVDSEADIDPE